MLYSLNNSFKYRAVVSPSKVAFVAKIIFKRMVNFDMKLELELNKKTIGNYKNSNGLEFDFECLCDESKFDGKNLSLGYSLIIDGNAISYHKILITIYTWKFAVYLVK